MANNAKTVLLLGLLTGIILYIGSFWGRSGLTVALLMSVLMNFVSYFFSDKIALRMHGAQPISREQAPRLFQIVEYLAGRGNLPMPRLYLIPSDSPNAFATGRNPQHASVAVTRGALNLLDENELTGVLDHELSHVANRDIMWMANMARFALFFGGRDRDDEGGGLGGLFMVILAPVAALLIQMWISRTREYQADAGGAELAGSPYGLASALQKLEDYSKRIPMETSPSAAHMFIMHPFSGGALLSLFSTHPPTQKRIARLLGRNS